MASAFKPRECKLSKEEGQCYGFFLRIEKDTDGHLVRVVEKGSPAEKGGLQDGDRVLRINGVFVDKKEHMQAWEELFALGQHSSPGWAHPHKNPLLWVQVTLDSTVPKAQPNLYLDLSKARIEVVDLVRQSGHSVTLLVLDGNSYEKAIKKQVNLKELGQSLKTTDLSDKELPPVMNGGAETWSQPRLCYLVKEGKSYGFSLKTVRGKKGVYMTDIIPQGVAMKAGILADDHVIEVNGENVENASHEEVVEKVKKSGSHVMFLLVDKETDKHHSERKIKFNRETASLKLLPHKPRVVEMKKGSNGYGFYLRAGPEKKGQIIKDIDPGSPAAEAGLKNNDLVVAVNGKSVEALDHDSVVEIIRESGDQTSLLVVDKETDNMYRLAHFSPFLYYQSEELPNGSIKEAPAPTSASLEVSSPDTTEEVGDQKPKLCRLVKGENGYGFRLNAIQDLPGSFAKEVQKGSPANLAGLEDEDIVIEVNGVNVLDEPYEKVVDRIQSSGKNVILLVCGKKAFDYFQAKKIPIVSSMADPLDDPLESKEGALAESEPDLYTAKERAHSTDSFSSSNSEDTEM